MNNITLSTTVDCGFTPVSNIFINNFMPEANGEYVKIYLYLLKCLNDKEVNVTISKLADRLEKTDADINRAIKYWEKKGILNISRNENNDITSVVVVNLDASLYKQDSCNLESSYSERSPKDTKKETPNDLPEPENTGTSLELPALKEVIMCPVDKSKAECDELRAFQFRVEKYFGRPLTKTDMDILLNLCYGYDLASIDCVEEILMYAVGRGKKSMRYIEKVTIACLEHDAKSLSEIKNYLESSSFTVVSVMQAFGLQKRLPGNDEMDYIAKWSDTFGFDNSLIIEACDRAMSKTNGPSFKYADSILTSWHNSGVRSMKDVKKLDDIYKAQAKATYASRNPNGKNPGKPLTKFSNFVPSDLDIDALETRLLSGNKGE